MKSSLVWTHKSGTLSQPTVKCPLAKILRLQQWHVKRLRNAPRLINFFWSHFPFNILQIVKTFKSCNPVTVCNMSWRCRIPILFSTFRTIDSSLPFTLRSNSDHYLGRNSIAMFCRHYWSFSSKNSVLYSYWLLLARPHIFLTQLIKVVKTHRAQLFLRPGKNLRLWPTKTTILYRHKSRQERSLQLLPAKVKQYDNG